jgi:hypothetical protein
VTGCVDVLNEGSCPNWESVQFDRSYSDDFRFYDCIGANDDFAHYADGYWWPLPEGGTELYFDDAGELTYINRWVSSNMNTGGFCCNGTFRTEQDFGTAGTCTPAPAAPADDKDTCGCGSTDSRVIALPVIVIVAMATRFRRRRPGQILAHAPHW